MGVNRRIKRNGLIKSYSVLSKRWKDKRQNDKILKEAGVDIKDELGKKPPLSVYMKMFAHVDNPVQTSLELPLYEIIEYADEYGINWRGKDPRNETGVMEIPMSDPGEEPSSDRGVVEIPILGDDEDK